MSFNAIRHREGTEKLEVQFSLTDPTYRKRHGGYSDNLSMLLSCSDAVPMPVFP